jgi:pentatricopeptide repeat protein
VTSPLIVRVILRVQRALDILPTLKSRGLEPNEITYNVIMGACGLAGRWKETNELLQAMEQAGLQPDAVSYGERRTLRFDPSDDDPLTPSGWGGWGDQGH